MPAKFDFRLTKTKEVFKSLSAFITNYVFELVKQLFPRDKKCKLRFFCWQSVDFHINRMWSSIRKSVKEMKKKEMNRNDRKFSLKFFVSRVKISSKTNDHSVKKNDSILEWFCGHFV